MKNILDSNTYRDDLLLALQNIDLSILENKKIIITGGLGLICSAIVDLLHIYNEKTKRPIDIYIADINEPFFYERYGIYKDIHFLKYNALEDINFDINANYIIHGAGLSTPELFVSKPVETMLSNFVGVKNLLEYALKCKTDSFLYISSSEVYGQKDNDSSFIENKFGSSDINTVRASYYESKRASEVLCRSYSEEYHIKTVIVRPGHIYGPTASMRDQRVSSSFAFKTAKGEDLELKSDGMTIRSYCYSVDCAVAILTVLLFGKNQESYNIGHEEKTTIKAMAEIYAKYGNVKLTVKEATEEDKKRFNPMNVATLDNTKIKEIGYKDSFSVKVGLEHTVKIIKEVYFD